MANDDEITKTGERQAPAFDSAKYGEKSAMLLVMGSGTSGVTGKMFKLVRPETVIGRSSEADLQLADDGVSRRHAVVTKLGDGRFVIHDLGSHNGTHINGTRVAAPTELTPGDKIQIGSTTVLMFAVQDALEAQFQRKLYDAATHDSLTGLFNRKYLYDAITKELPYCNRHQVPLSMLMIDIDLFKAVNDSHGHPAGDFVLCRVADGLIQATRAEDLVSRFGGEEFAVLLRDTDAAGALVCGERCRATVAAARHEIKSRPVNVTLSVGVATLTNRCFASPDALFSAADQALYAAKAAGRNQVMLYGVGTAGKSE